MSAAQKAGLAALSITDHDTMAAYPEAIRLGAAHQVEVLPGIEITAHQQGLSLHILGFGLDCHSASLLAGLQVIQQARRQRNRQIIDKLQGFNLAIDMDDLPSGEGQNGRPHIARVLVNKGIVRSEQEAFARFLRKDGAAYVPRQLLPVRQAIAMIAEAGGLAVLAHPGSLKLSDSVLQALIYGLMKDGLVGIEAYHPMNSTKLLKFLLQVGQAAGLLITGGSDFHGFNGDQVPLGETGGKRRVPLDLLAKLQSRLATPQMSAHHHIGVSPPCISS